MALRLRCFRYSPVTNRRNAKKTAMKT